VIHGTQESAELQHGFTWPDGENRLEGVLEDRFRRWTDRPAESRRFAGAEKNEVGVDLLRFLHDRRSRGPGGNRDFVNHDVVEFELFHQFSHPRRGLISVPTHTRRFSQHGLHHVQQGQLRVKNRRQSYGHPCQVLRRGKEIGSEQDGLQYTQMITS
jgi:hypothetical protein